MPSTRTVVWWDEKFNNGCGSKRTDDNMLQISKACMAMIDHQKTTPCQSWIEKKFLDMSWPLDPSHD
ncbi:hypothetical protein BPOR_0197g00060 [Botrytis porri]|uniref:Uncharacterized protein n=1 Tax=Botrytis porri TaxID=87229 RepID=A0A4Z1KTQ8_9HELO|nr:hypothetical protein BPOR_0197g00060 [Botrytis porri]